MRGIMEGLGMGKHRPSSPSTVQKPMASARIPHIHRVALGAIGEYGYSLPKRGYVPNVGSSYRANRGK